MMAIRLSDADRAILDALVKRRAAELEPLGVEVTAASVIRSLLRSAAEEQGITAGPAKKARAK